MCGSLNRYLCICVQYMFASVGAMIKKNTWRERHWFILQREPGRELARYLKTRRVKDGNKKQSDYKRKQISEVENRKQMGWRDPKTVKSHWQLLDCSTLSFWLCQNILSHHRHIKLMSRAIKYDLQNLINCLLLIYQLFFYPQLRQITKHLLIKLYTAFLMRNIH